MTLKNNSSGFTLVEVVITLGISAVVILGAGSFLKTVFTSNVATNKRLDKSEFFDQISKTINNRMTCAESLKNLSVGSNLTDIVNKGHKLYSVGQVLAKDSKLTSINLEQNPNWVPAADGYGPASIKIVVNNNGVSLTKYFPVSIQLDQNKKVVGCSQKLALGSVKDDIYKDVCTDVVGGSLSSNKCRWTKPVHVSYYYIPAPTPSPAPGNSCSGPICDYYLSVLGRYPDAGGKAYWEGDVANGASLADVLSNIKASKEANGIAWGQAEWDNYYADITKRGMDAATATKQCGVDISC